MGMIDLLAAPLPKMAGLSNRVKGDEDGREREKGETENSKAEDA
jgi:hypothetical protein